MDDKNKLIEKINSLRKDEDTSLNDYVDETLECFKNDCNRATIILLWSIWVFYLYKKIREYGLNNFKKFIQSKNIKFEGRINQIYDLQKIKDTQILFLCRELGFYDKNIENQLSNLLSIRNSCAHVAQLNVTKYQLFSYIEQLCDYIKVINELNFDKIHRPFLDELKEMKESQLMEIIPDLGSDLLFSYIEQVLEEVTLISDWRERNLKRGYYTFLSCVIKYRNDDAEKIKLFEIIFGKIFSGEIEFAAEITSDLREILNFSAIKKLILKKGHLDNIISIFVNSFSFINARDNSRALLLFKKEFSSDQLNTIANAYLSNRQITESTGANSALKILLKENIDLLDKDLIEALREKGLNLN